jgi:hypothetical protein
VCRDAEEKSKIVAGCYQYMNDCLDLHDMKHEQMVVFASDHYFSHAASSREGLPTTGTPNCCHAGQMIGNCSKSRMGKQVTHLLRSKACRRLAFRSLDTGLLPAQRIFYETDLWRARTRLQLLETRSIR